MAYGKIKADAIIRDNSGSDEEITMATIVGLDSNKASLTGATFTGDVTLNAQQELRLADSDSSNYIAFASPATVSTNSTWTLPSDAPSAGEVLKVSSVSSNNPTLEWGTDVGGKILQVKETAVRSRTSYNSANFVDTGLNVTITPEATSSKILIIINAQMGGPNGGYQAHSQLYRHVSGGSETAIADGSGGTQANVTHYVMTMTSYGNYPAYPINAQVLDTPSTTSAVTYRYKIKPQSQTWYFSGTGSATSISTHSSIVAMEIAG